MAEIIITKGQSIVTFNNVTATYENSFICRVLEQAAESKINIDMIAQSPTTDDKISFGFTFADNDTPKLLKIVKSGDCSALPLINSGNVKVTVKSRDMIDNTGFASKVFSVLKKLDCLALLVTTGIDEISILIHESDCVDLEQALREVF